MDDLKLLEWMDLIGTEYVQEAHESLINGNETARTKVRWWHYTGIAAGITMSLISGGILMNGGFSGGEGKLDNGGYVGTMASDNGNLMLAILMLSLAISGFFLFLIIRRKRDGR